MGPLAVRRVPALAAPIFPARRFLCCRRWRARAAVSRISCWMAAAWGLEEDEEEEAALD